mmetsp:Transcript_77946/g.215481  ORF Transcript_77946/g.215481 Transcript_77946/m.215481 type:complete len:201 (-) Transcript_77946:1184-1786(-)
MFAEANRLGARLAGAGDRLEPDLVPDFGGCPRKALRHGAVETAGAGLGRALLEPQAPVEVGRPGRLAAAAQHHIAIFSDRAQVVLGHQQPVGEGEPLVRAVRAGLRGQAAALAPAGQALARAPCQHHLRPGPQQPAERSRGAGSPGRADLRQVPGSGSLQSRVPGLQVLAQLPHLPQRAGGNLHIRRELRTRKPQPGLEA